MSATNLSSGEMAAIAQAALTAEQAKQTPDQGLINRHMTRFRSAAVIDWLCGAMRAHSSCKEGRATMALPALTLRSTG